MAPPLRPGTASSLFTDHFGRLVVLLRLEPANVPAQKEALRQAMTVLRMGPVHLETGVEYSAVPDETTLKGRLLSRRVEVIHFEPGAAAGDVLFVARALADDKAPVIGSPGIAIELLPASAPLGPRLTPAPQDISPQVDFTAETPSGRSRTITGPVEESRRLAHAFEVAVTQSYWVEALHAAQALVAMANRYPEHERRSYHLALRRMFSRPIMHNLIQYAMRATEEEHRVAEVLDHGGLEAVELAIEHIMRVEPVGPRRFLFDFIARRPEALPLLIPYLDSDITHVVCHAAGLLGRIGVADAIGPLRRVAEHPNARIRQAAVQALGHFHDHAVIEPLRRSLSDRAPAIRVSAAYALAEWNSAGLAMPILAALETEKDAATWRELVLALGRIQSAEAANTLVAMALDRKALLRSGGRSVAQRLVAVESLSAAGHVHALRGLERVAKEAEGVVRAAAEKTVEEGRGR